MAGGRDWYAWHLPYADPGSPLSRRLRTVQGEIDAWLDERPEPLLRVVSACAGQGRDLLEVLARRPDAGRVSARLIESDARNVAEAEARIEAAGLAGRDASGVAVVRADAGKFASYAGAVPADLVLLVGVFGNVTEDDVRRTIAGLPRLCAAGATVIWTRSRDGVDRTPALRSWFAAGGFVERAFHAPPDVTFSVGVHRFEGRPLPLLPAGELFAFVG